MDVVAVRNRDGLFYSTEFNVRLKVPIYGVEQASAVFLGLKEDEIASENIARTVSAEQIIIDTESEDALNVDDSDQTVDATEGSAAESSPELRRYRLLRRRLEPFLVDVSTNHMPCDHPNLIAYVGDKQSLRFYDPVSKHHYVTPPPRLLSHFNLIMGKNVVTCTHRASAVKTSFPIWTYHADARLIIMDIDGTITKSDVTGYITTVYFGIYSYVHFGLVEWLHSLREMFNYQCLYLTARPYSHRKQTKLLLNMIRGQINAECELPEGPLFTTADTAITAFYHEFVVRDQARSKSDVLSSIWDVFKAAGCTSLSPFKLGVGNQEHDAMAYNSVGVPGEAVLVVNKESKIVVWKYSRPPLARMGARPRDRKNASSSSSSTAAAAAAAPTDATAGDDDDEREETDAAEPTANVSANGPPSPSLPPRLSLSRSRSERLPTTQQVPGIVRAGQSSRLTTANGSADDLAVTTRSSSALLELNPRDHAVTLALQSAPGVYTFNTYADPMLLQYVVELELRRSTSEEYV